MEAVRSRTLYVGSGSPYAWRVWLALEHNPRLDPGFFRFSPHRGADVIGDVK